MSSFAWCNQQIIHQSPLTSLMPLQFLSPCLRNWTDSLVTVNELRLGRLSLDMNDLHEWKPAAERWAPSVSCSWAIGPATWGSACTWCLGTAAGRPPEHLAIMAGFECTVRSIGQLLGRRKGIIGSRVPLSYSEEGRDLQFRDHLIKSPSQLFGRRKGLTIQGIIGSKVPLSCLEEGMDLQFRAS